MGRKVTLLLLISLGSIAWSIVMIKSGPYTGFWGANGHDGVWHIALANSLARGSLENPVFSGTLLQNYHIGFDVILAVLHLLTRIPISFLYFQLIPPVLAVAIGLATFKFVFGWRKNFYQSIWATFFVYFGGSFSWFFGGGESMFWSQQSISTLINPPFAMSLLILLLGLILLQNKKWVLAGLVIGILIQIKVYAGVIALGGLLILGVYDFLSKRGYTYLKTLALALPISIILFLPLNTNSGTLLVWQPFWFLETMMGLSDRVGWTRFYEAMLNYRSGGNIAKMTVAYFVAFLIFWFGNLGTRVVKEIYFLQTLRNIKKIEWQNLFLLSGIGMGIIFPMFFLQEGTPWNTIQFFYYSLIFSAILAGVSLGELLGKLKSKKLKILLSISFVVLTVPTTIISLKDIYLPSRPPAKLPQKEFEALKFLSNLPNGVVLTYPYDDVKARDAVANPPRPLYLYESTAYVSAFSNKSVFLEDEVNLTIMNYEWKGRREVVEQFYSSLDESFAYNFLRENNIEYIYWVKPQRATLGESQLGITKIFENDEAEVYKVDR